MSRITSLNILLEQEGKDYLSELYGRVIENVQKELLSADMKNRDLSGDPTSGSVEAKRFANASPKAYGTARAAGKGDALRARPVTVPIDQDDEIVEEIEEKDIRLYGAVAQPVYARPYAAEKIPLADAYAVELFYHYGTTVITPDLIFKPKYVTSSASGDSNGGSNGSGGGSVTANAKLSALTLGSLTLSPTFDADTTTYTAATTNATNTVTATAADNGATIAITNGSTTVANGSAATWETGENTLTIVVTNGTATKTYTVTVTKS